jgi:hypothetical protein
MYATCVLATAARIQVLSVDMARLMVGGEVPTSQTCSDSCDQKRASVEFWDRLVCMTREPLPLDLEPADVRREVKGISSSFCVSCAPDERELESPEVMAAAAAAVLVVAGLSLSFFVLEKGSRIPHLDFGFSPVVMASLFLRGSTSYDSVFFSTYAPGLVCECVKSCWKLMLRSGGSMYVEVSDRRRSRSGRIWEGLGDRTPGEEDSVVAGMV